MVQAGEVHQNLPVPVLLEVQSVFRGHPGDGRGDDRRHAFPVAPGAQDGVGKSSPRRASPGEVRPRKGQVPGLVGKTAAQWNCAHFHVAFVRPPLLADEVFGKVHLFPAVEIHGAGIRGSEDLEAGPSLVELGHPFDAFFPGNEKTPPAHVAGGNRDHPFSLVDLSQGHQKSHGGLRPGAKGAVQHLFLSVVQNHKESSIGFGEISFRWSTKVERILFPEDFTRFGKSPSRRILGVLGPSLNGCGR